MAKILVIDDEPSIRSVLRDILEMEDYEVEEAKDGIDALSKVKKNKFDAAICDIKMPKMDGMELLERINVLSPDTPVIMISGHGNIETAVEAVKKGAFDYISKPPDLNRLLITIRNALDKSSLVQETKVLKKKIKKSGGVQTIIGESEGIGKIKATIDRVAPTDARVLVTGPNGTGKELVARWIHEKSERAQNQIVEVNCAAIPAELIESELFGHEKGSFTSAHKQRIGKFEQAHGGTLFLDEIGDMSLSAQAKVLRALQEGRITRVGGDKDIKVDVRVIAATNKDLRQEIDAKRFREDLYHRLAVIIIQVPSLNDRKADIPLLVDHFIESVCNEYGRPKKEIEKGALQLLQEVDWTGNIRELRNVIERLIILSEQNISLADVQNYVLPTMNRYDQFETLFDKFENEAAVQKFVAEEYQKYKQNKAKA
ncbi:MAG: two-component system nitrogen regulation response regulator NtrX [Aureispira sp.]|jgi:two-component system nitrogen regulation response regulator NtrX